MRLIRNSFSLLIRAVRKLIIDPIKYARTGGYRAEAYWSDRLGRYGLSSRGPGHEGLSENENDRLYSEARGILEEILDAQGVWRKTPSVLEVGPGTGIWTEMCWQNSVENYTGLDITSTQFDQLSDRFPSYQFLKGDATKSTPAGSFDLVLCLDVIEHITEEAGLGQLLHGLAKSLSPGGLLVLSYPMWRPGRINLFYLRFWNERVIRKLLEQQELLLTKPFRVGSLQVYRQPNG